MSIDKDMIERLAREAGLIEPGWYSVPVGKLPAFAALIAALIAEECARVCDQMPAPYCRDPEYADCAEAIRENFKPSTPAVVGVPHLGIAPVADE